MNFRKSFLFFFIVGSISGCQAIPVENIKAQNLRDQAFQDNINDVKLNTSEEKDVIELLKEYKNGFNRSDKNVIARLLSEDFELRYIALNSEKSEIIISAQSRSDYLERRLGWSSSTSRGENLAINIRDLRFNKERTEAVVSTGTTYLSKYFHPRYIEIINIKKIKNEWRLHKIFVIPAEPKPVEVKVSLISLADISKYIELSNNLDSYRSFVDANGPDALFEEHIKLSCCIEDERQRLVVVFPEPPADGSIITVDETAMGYTKTYRTATKFRRNSPYTIFIGWGWYGSHLTVEVEVYVDGVLAGKGILP